MMKKQLKVPFIIYSDFEALTKEVEVIKINIKNTLLVRMDTK